MYSPQDGSNHQLGPSPQQNIPPIGFQEFQTPYPPPPNPSQNFQNQSQVKYLPHTVENSAPQNQYPSYIPPGVQTQPGYPVTNMQNQHLFQNETTVFAPTAPPADHLEPIPGYENTKFDIEVPILPPPATPYEVPKYEGGPINLVSLTENEARDALYEYASNECCYGKNVPMGMVITKIENTSAYHYKLKTFAESRKTAWKYEPYKGEPLMTYGTVIVPGPWDIPVPLPDKTFVDEKTSMEVPGTANIKICFLCNGAGVIPCKKCGQSGWTDCTSCKGKGCRNRADEQHEECPFCFGRGKDRCNPCKGNGIVECDTCKGIKQLKHFIELKITWTTYVDDYIVERTDLPDNYIKNVGGTQVFHEDQPMVGALVHFTDNELNSGATKALQERIGIVSKSERILRQRQTVNMVPVSEVHFTWKDKRNKFFVYGTNHTVYAPDYPENCCYGWCSIL